MKNFFAIFLMLLLLCSCSVQKENDVPEDPASDISGEEQTAEENTESKPLEEAEEIDPIEKACVAEVRGMWVGSERDRWRRDGFTATPGNVTILDGGVFSYTFTIRTDSVIFSFPAMGTLSYRDMDNFVLEKQGDHILATWGTEGTLENGTRYFITLGKILFVDKDFGLLGQILLPENSLYHMWPMSVSYSEETGYVIPVYKIPKDGSKPSGTGLIFTYNEDFKMVSESGGNPVIYETYGENYLPQFSRDSYLYKFGETTYLSSIMEYNLENSTGYLAIGKDDKFFDGDRAVAFIHGKQYDPENPDSPFGSYAVLFEGDSMTDYIKLDEFYPFEIGNGGKPVASVTIFDSGKKAEVIDNFYCRTILLNFKKKTVDVKYEYTDENVSEAFDVSSDTLYSLHKASYTAGGDAESYSVVLKDNITGSMEYIFSGGSGVSCGFLKNGDIYYQCADALKIYSPENREVLFDLSRKFPLNASDPNKDYRCVVAFRRDPEEFSFMVVYWEGPAKSLYSEDSGGLPVYNIGFFDKSGNLLETYESKIPVALGMYNWPQDAVIYYKDGKYTVTTLGDKGDPGINFTFDHVSGEFSPAKENRG